VLDVRFGGVKGGEYGVCEEMYPKECSTGEDGTELLVEKKSTYWFTESPSNRPG